MRELLRAKRDLRLKEVLRDLSRWDALLIDDLGYVQQSREEMEVLFTLLAERYQTLLNFQQLPPADPTTG